MYMVDSHKIMERRHYYTQDTVSTIITITTTIVEVHISVVLFLRRKDY